MNPIQEAMVTEQMCQALQRLQRVHTWDFDGRYAAAYAGISSLDPRDSSSASLILGRSLAYRTHYKRVEQIMEMAS